MYQPKSDRRLGGPDSKHARTVKRKIIEAYDRMMTGPSPVELDALWAHVRQGEDELEEELHRRTGFSRFRWMRGAHRRHVDYLATSSSIAARRT